MAVKYARETVEATIESSCAMMGIQKLKEKQKDAITLFVDGNDVLVILPTGFGKSLCFALLPLVFDCQVMQVAKYCAGKRLARLGVRLLSASLALHLAIIVPAYYDYYCVLCTPISSTWPRMCAHYS